MTTALPPRGNPSVEMVAPRDPSGIPSRSNANPLTVVSPPEKNRSLIGNSGRTGDSNSISGGGPPISGGGLGRSVSIPRNPTASPTRAPAARMTRRTPGNVRYTNICVNVLRNPTSEPIARAASFVSTLITSPRLGSTGSSRLLRTSPPDTDDSRTCSNSRSTIGRSSGSSSKFEVSFCPQL